MTQPIQQAVEPIAWALFNPATGKVDHRCYQREDAARAGAAAHSNRWRTLISVPLFLAPLPPERGEGS